MSHHHDGELIYTLHEDHHRTSVECHFHGECPKKKINLPNHLYKTTLKTKFEKVVQLFNINWSRKRNSNADVSQTIKKRPL